MMTTGTSAKREAAEGIAARLRAAGHTALLAGGCVRDLLLGVEPKDYDVATSARPEEVTALFPRTVTVGARFGVVLVVEGDVATEVATFRSDGAYSDGRRPDEVRYTTDPREDAERRDFTINGMMLDPAQTGVDAVLDAVGGRADLQAGIVRAIGDAGLRFREDRLRMLRAVRFAARLGFAMEAGTMAAIRAEAAEIAVVSRERVRDELTRMLTEGAARRAFELLHETGLLRHVLPEVERMRGVEQPPQFHPEGDVWDHTLMMLEGLAAGCSATLAWGVLLHDVGKPATFTPPSGEGDRIRFHGHVEVGVRVATEICERLRMSNDETAQIAALVENHMRFRDVGQMKESTLKRFLRLERFDEHMELHRLDCMSSHGKLDNYEFARAARERVPEAEIRPVLLVTGRELIAAGYKPGRRFAEMLRVAEDAQLEGRVATTDEAMKLICEQFPEGTI